MLPANMPTETLMQIKAPESTGIFGAVTPPKRQNSRQTYENTGFLKK